MNNGKLQAKQEKLKSLHCPSSQSSLFNSRDSLLNTQHSKESAIRCAQPLFIDVNKELLRRGQCVRFRAPGLSMYPTIKEGETITVVPISSFDIKRRDIILYLVGKKVIAHRVVRIKREKNDFKSHSSAHGAIQSTSDSSPNSSIQASNRYKKQNSQLLFILRGDASVICDEPVEAQQILGKVVFVDRDGRSINLCSRKARIFRFAYDWTSRLKRLTLHILKVNQEAGLTFGDFW